MAATRSCNTVVLDSPRFLSSYLTIYCVIRGCYSYIHVFGCYNRHVLLRTDSTLRAFISYIHVFGCYDCYVLLGTDPTLHAFISYMHILQILPSVPFFLACMSYRPHPPCLYFLYAYLTDPTLCAFFFLHAYLTDSTLRAFISYIHVFGCYDRYILLETDPTLCALYPPYARPRVL